jgi:hypothetical protein
MRHDAVYNRAGEVFFKKTLPWPTNNPHWQQDYISLPWQTEIILQLNELGDDSVTRFNFTNSTFLPSEEVFWVSFYCTVSQHLNSIFRINSLYWVTLNNLTGSTPVEPRLLGLTENHDFLFRDSMDLLRYGFTNWTTASLVEPIMRIEPTTNNLAWRLSLTCEVSTQPTAAPTTAAPTLPPQSEEPTTSPIDPNPSPLNNTWNITTEENGNHLAIALSIPFTLLLLSLTIVCCVFIVWRRKSKEQKKNQTKSNIRNLLSRTGDDAQPSASPLYQAPFFPNPRRNELLVYSSEGEWQDIKLEEENSGVHLFDDNIYT